MIGVPTLLRGKQKDVSRKKKIGFISFLFVKIGKPKQFGKKREKKKKKNVFLRFPDGE